jgi:hypothetical protein
LLHLLLDFGLTDGPSLQLGGDDAAGFSLHLPQSGL